MNDERCYAKKQEENVEDDYPVYPWDSVFDDSDPRDWLFDETNS